MNFLFVDTSALYALLDADDRFHRAAAAAFSNLSPGKDLMLCSSYVVLETLALLQTRVGIDAVTKWKTEFQAILEIVWVDRRLHEEALTALVAANQPAISLTDWTSFLIMRERGIELAFSFDHHFAQQGFHLLPAR
ncbi:MAG: PIN domain-containing protein [Acidobacteriota bacterium]